MWLVARTQPLRERKLRAALAADVPPTTVYVPMRTIIVRPRHVRKPRTYEYPVFSPYVFIELGDVRADFRRIFHSDVWVRPVRFRDKLAIVKDEGIARLRELEAIGAFNDPLVGNSRYKVGDIVRLLHKPLFEDTKAIITAFLPGRKVKVALPTCWLKIDLDELSLFD